MASFNLTANINARLNTSNVRAIANQLRSQLSVTAKVNIALANNTSANVSVLTKSLKTLNQELVGISKNSKDAEQALRSLGNAFQNINTQLSSNLKAQQALNNTANAAKNATTQMEQFGRQAGLAFRRFAGFTIATGAIAGLISSISSATKEAISFQREIVRISQVTGRSLNSLQGLTNEITRLSTSLGVSSNELLEISVILAQAGLTAGDTQKALEALAKSSLAPTFTDIKETTEGAVAIMAQFGLQAKDLEKALGSVNAVSAAFAVESDDIIAAVKRAGGAFAATSAGISEGRDALNEFIAIFTSVRATTRESAETIATGLRTIFTRIQRPATIQFLQELGINLQDLEGKFVGPFEAVTRLSQGLARLNTRDPQFARIVEELGGFRQVGKVIPLLAQQESRIKALQVAQQGANSLTKDAEKAQEAWSVQIAKVREEFVALIRDISNTSTFKAIVQLLIDMTRQFIAIADAIKPVLPLIAAFGAFKGASALAQFSKGLFGRGGIRFHDGGYVGRQRYASGGDVRVRGLVPGGKGMKDDFPATLQEGEFVIRRKAVDAIGKENLDRMNKTGRMEFASGGRIISQKRVGAAIFQPFNDNIGVTPITVQPSESPAIEKPKNYVLVRESLGEDDQKKVVDIVEPSIINGLIRSTKSITGMDIPNNTAKQIFEVSNAPAVMGSIFEGIISASTTKGGKFDDTIDPNRPIDFTNGIGALQQTFKKLRSIKYIEAKYSADQAQPAKIKPKIVNQLNWEEGFANSKGELTDKAKKTLAQRGKKLDLETSKSKKTKGEKEAKDYLNQLRNRSKDQFLNDDEKIKAKTALETLKYSKGRIPGILNGIIGRRRAFNSGGKVPALLTRGEYVINRNAARSIGYGNLERLNYADKYNKGGIVRQKYGIGSFVKRLSKKGDLTRIGLLKSAQSLRTVREYQSSPYAEINRARASRAAKVDEFFGSGQPGQPRSNMSFEDENKYLQKERAKQSKNPYLYGRSARSTGGGGSESTGGGTNVVNDVLSGGGETNSILQEIAQNTAATASNTGKDGAGAGAAAGAGAGAAGGAVDAATGLFSGLSSKNLLQSITGGFKTGGIGGALKGGLGSIGGGLGKIGKNSLSLLKGLSGVSSLGLSFLGGAVGSLVGGKAGGAISGGSTGAGLGAQFGSMIFPGVGTAVGGVIGGIGGAALGAFSAGKEEALQKQIEKTGAVLNKSSEDVGEAFSNFEKAKTPKAAEQLKKSFETTVAATQEIVNQDTVQRSGILSSIGNKLPASIATTFGFLDDPDVVARQRGEDIKSQLAGQRGAAEALLFNEVSKGVPIAKAVDKIGAGAQLTLASQIGGQNELRQLGAAETSAEREEIARKILLEGSGKAVLKAATEEKKRQQALEESSKALQKSNIELANFKDQLEDMGASIDRAANAGNEFALRNQALLGNGIISQARENVFDNVRAYSNKELQQQAAFVTNSLGGTQNNPLARDVFSGLSSVNDLTTRLPQELAKIAAGGFDDDTQALKIEETINSQFSGIPQQIRQQLISSIRNETQGVNRQGGSLGSFAQDGARQLAEQFTKPLVEIGKKTVDAQNKAIGEYEQAVGKWIDLQKESNATYDSTVQKQIENRNQITSLDRNLTFEEMTEGFRTQQNISAMRAGASGSDLNSILNRLAILDAQRQQAATDVADYRNTGIGGPQRGMQLANEQARIQSQILEAENVLNQIANNTAITASATQKLQELENKKQAAANILEKVATGDVMARMQFMKNLNLGQLALGGGNFTGEQLTSALQGIREGRAIDGKDSQETEKLIREILSRNVFVQEAVSRAAPGKTARDVLVESGEERRMRSILEENARIQPAAGGAIQERQLARTETFLTNAADRFDSIQQSISEVMTNSAQTLSNIPSEIKLDSNVNVNVNGAETLLALQGDLRKYVEQQISIALNRNLSPQQRIESGYGSN